MNDMDRSIIDKIAAEMSLCYESIGRRAADNITIIAASLQEAIHFASFEQVHESFKRAKDIEAIPTQRTIKEAFKNYCEEVLKYKEKPSDNVEIGYEDERSAWLPTDELKKAINLRNAIKNYCDAIGGNMPYEYMKTHHTKEEMVGEHKHITWENPEQAHAFDRPIKEYLVYLYKKYWRSLPIASGYHADWMLNLGLIPPSVEEFKIMLKAEGAIQ